MNGWVYESMINGLMDGWMDGFGRIDGWKDSDCWMDSEGCIDLWIGWME